MKSSTILLALASLLALGCSDQADLGGGGGGAGGAATSGLGGANASSGGSAGSSGTDNGPAGYTVSGIWDVVATQGGDAPANLAITLDADHFAVRFGRESLVAGRQGDAFSIAVNSEYAAPAALRAAPAAQGNMDLGAFPLPLSGSWSIANAGIPEPGSGCGMNLKAGSLQASCGRVRLPRWMPRIARGTMNAVRSTPLPSIFGDFGGVWVASFAGGGTCSFRFEGAKISSTCVNTDGLNGLSDIAFEGDVASGRTSGGIEFSAHRR